MTNQEKTDMRFIEVCEKNHRGLIHINVEHIVLINEVSDPEYERDDENTHITLSNGEVIKCWETIAEIYNAL